MKIEHVAIWTKDLEAMRVFYVQKFNATASKRYENKGKGFASYFLRFSSGARLELMQRTDVTGTVKKESLGFAHLAFSLGDKTAVDQLTTLLIAEGYECLDGPRTTGDGYYESVFLDPEGNPIELTI
ncbi:lactoylglutathione lyase [Streptohalobacillus salinus]|uniref:Lactoylglutathione lyase n=1 Tax=Streptohalobacillus salinus TaxID=621096 RepID=A0A2V3WCI5_9BACI|nr:VOC family protein [Streptohalobacillus salinus]PXW86479.1 lactoylglutathione lyase [Streptohalobacillus salinus]